MRIGIGLAIVTMAVCLGGIAFAFEFILRFLPIHFDKKLVDPLFHSLFLLAVMLSLLMWVYQPLHSLGCCVLRRGTVCDGLGCSHFIQFWCGCCIRSGLNKKTKNGLHVKQALMVEASWGDETAKLQNRYQRERDTEYGTRTGVITEYKKSQFKGSEMSSSKASKVSVQNGSAISVEADGDGDHEKKQSATNDDIGDVFAAVV